MKTLLYALLVIFVSSVTAEKVKLEAKNKCSLDTISRKISCKSHSENYELQKENGKWHYKCTPKQNCMLNIIKEDAHAIILSQDVYFSGTRIFYLYKICKRFTLSEIAYSDILNNDEVETTMGFFSVSL